jgi:hypothetical protein
MTSSVEQSGANGEAWEQVLASLCRLQSLLSEAVLAGRDGGGALHRTSLFV